MSFYKVKVENKILGYDAPTIYLEASNDNEAIIIAKSRSGLGKYDNEIGWKFTPYENNLSRLRTRMSKRGRKQSQKEKAKGA